MGDAYNIDVTSSKDGVLDVALSGAFLFANGIPDSLPVTEKLAGNFASLRFSDAGVKDWDSALLVFLMTIYGACTKAGVDVDATALPKGVRRLLHLASAVPEREGAARKFQKTPFLEKVGASSIATFNGIKDAVSFIGDTTISVLRFAVGKARYRPGDLWLTIQECGPGALGIVTVITVLVGAILAFVGSIQLKMFGAEVYVANLVGLGMVIEMGALMTGIILAGRTGASFAAQIGTMQVNEEIDALKTMGIPPIDYLVLPRVLALVIMTPLLVVYADILGILGGSAVGILLLDIPPRLFFDQTFSMMTMWQCAQGLIKGSSFGLIIAIAGCMRGMQCGRSAASVGEAATSAVVTSIVAIVIVDALWTFIFLVIG